MRKREARIRDYNERRDAILRRLDVSAFIDIILATGKWSQPVKENVYLAAMHKCRLHVAAFSEAEKQQSRDWLLANGYTEAL